MNLLLNQQHQEIVVQKSRTKTVVFTPLLRLMTWWKQFIFPFLGLSLPEKIRLRRLCCLFRKALPIPMYTWYPHSKYSSLQELVGKIGEVTQQGDLPTTPKLLIMENGVLPVKPMLKCLASPVKPLLICEMSRSSKLAKVPKMVEGVMSNVMSEQLEATTSFRKLLSSERDPPIQAVIDIGVVPRFVQFLQCADTPKLQFEAAWALTNIASGTSDHTRFVIEMGAVPLLVQLLSSTNDDVRQQAVWAMGNIAGDSPECRDLILHADALPPLLAQLDLSNSKLSMLRIGAWALSNFCRGKPRPPFELVSPALPTLGKLLFSLDDEVRTDACWTLFYLSDGPNDKITAVMESGVTMRLVELLMHPSAAVQYPALRTVNNLVTGNELQTQGVIDCSALPCLLSLLSSVKNGFKKEACWALSNITAGSKDQIQAVVDANIIPPLIHLLLHGEFDVKKEAAWAISNATNGCPCQIAYLVARGCIPPLCDLLTLQDNKIVQVALDGLSRILNAGKLRMNGDQSLLKNPFAKQVEHAGGLNKLNTLQYHDDVTIRETALKIVKHNYFA